MNAVAPRPDEALTAHERDQLAAHEAIIEAGCETFMQVGSALIAIHDGRLYRETYDSFEDYVCDRWGFTRQRAYQLIEAAGVAKNLVSTMVDTRRLNERQARELASLDPDEQRVVYAVAKGTAPDGRVTAAHLKALVEVLAEIAKVGAVDDGTGQHVPWDALTPERKIALLQVNVSDEIFERYERQRAAFVRVMMSCNSVEWYTPSQYIDAAREVLGAIDLDPASCAQANETVGATRFFTCDDGGLGREWQGRIFMNPPYGSLASKFTEHLVGEYAAGRVTAAIILLSAHNTDCNWFQPLWDYPCCFTDHRISFINGDDGQPRGGNNHGSVFFYLGSRGEDFARVFTRFGRILRPW